VTHQRHILFCLLLASALSCPATAQMASSHPQRQVQPKAGAPVADFVDVADLAGLTARTVTGGEHVKRHILESTGAGVALIDYDNDGWLDIFLVNGIGTEPQSGPPSTNHLYRNNHDGTFTDVTERAGLVRHGWGQGVSVGDYNGDGRLDLFVTYYGQNVLYRNNGDGTFTDVTSSAGLATALNMYSTGSAFFDFDGDGKLDLFVAHYIQYDEATTHEAGQGNGCKWRGLTVFCGPRGLKPTRNSLYRNLGNGTFEDVSDKSGIAKPLGYNFTPLVADFNNDGWLDIYVANDSMPSLLFLNNRNGTFNETGVLSGVAYNDDGREQSGMGTDVADFDGDGFLDIVKTNFEQDTNTLYRNRGDGTFDDVTFPSGLGVNTSFVGWGTGFLDFDSDGWPDIFMANGHVYPEVDTLNDTSFQERKILYHNRGDGTFDDVSLRGGPGLLLQRSSRGVAFGDLFNTGATDIVVNNIGDHPTLLFNRMPNKNHAITFQLTGKDPNRAALGARVTVFLQGHRMENEVRSGGTYLSQSDLRLRFGLGAATKVAKIEIRWPDSHTDTLTDLEVGRIITVQYGGKIIASSPYQAFPARLHR